MRKTVLTLAIAAFCSLTTPALQGPPAGAQGAAPAGTPPPGGRGPRASWNDLVQYVDFNRDFQAWVRAAKAAGKTVEQASLEYKHPDKYVGYTPPNPMQIRNYMQAIYDEAK